MDLHCYQLDHTFINFNCSQLGQKNQWESLRGGWETLVEYLKHKVEFSVKVKYCDTKGKII